MVDALDATSDTAHVAEQFRLVIGQPVDVTVRQIESERIYLVSVPEESIQAASAVAARVEAELAHESETVVVTVRPTRPSVQPTTGPVRDLQDPRVDALVQLLTSRSRTSEAQPSLSYIPNNTASLAQVTGARHHLIFGRRGAGKTALLTEARRILAADHYITAWTNAQPLRTEGVERAFLHIARILVDALITEAHTRSVTKSQFFIELSNMRERVDALLEATTTPGSQVRRLLPDLQRCIKRATVSTGSRVYLFVDDFYYIPRSQQPDVLDLLHACTRDADVWLKIASIRHLSRWYRSSPPVGLQTGQDVNIIDLDLSLQNPSAAIKFLSTVLSSYCRHSGITTTGNVFGRQAVDRLVFASGGVPRDFLTLAASAIPKARSRAGRTVGSSDVNQAAGDAAKSKIGELEDDLASNAGFSDQTLRALSRIREFCLDEKGYTYFRVDFRDKESKSDEYGILSRLLEVRLAHLIDPSVSDGDRAGERSECYTLDLSQYSGYRLKQNISVLDFDDGRLISKRTRRRTAGETEAPSSPTITVGVTARQVVGILRASPRLNLSRFSDLVRLYEPIIQDLEKALRGGRSSTIDELVLNLNRPHAEIADALSDLIQQGRIREIDADGVPAYALAR